LLEREDELGAIGDLLRDVGGTAVDCSCSTARRESARAR
jgi:hypothetical protein